ncbi:hypothetical protein Dsin_011994 [Dipteronia sinensis]|uniref:Cytochrome P450 n=1 Tax=Dipteronia sinensis TaxID=43782 RepID=A0AAE0AIH0_9ROSI|nr:hypothetical protein Dsin_011994 [Dipteronia sinensis]
MTTGMELQLFSLPYFFFVSLLSLSLYVYFYVYSAYKKSRKPGFKLYPLVGALPGFIKNRHRFLEWTTEAVKDCPTHSAVFHRPGKLHGVFTANPSNIEYILKTNFENYLKGERFISLLEDFIGQGIFNSIGELWKVQRKTASYEFNTKSLRNFVIENVISKISACTFLRDLRLITYVKWLLTLIRVVSTEMEQPVLISCVRLKMQPYSASGDSVANLWRIKKFFNIESERKLKKSIQIVHDFANHVIRSRMEAKAEKVDDDLLSRFIGNGENSPEFLRDIIISFILAGRDTTSSALSWFFWLLSSRPDVERNILKELETIRKQNGKKSAILTVLMS